MSEQALDLRSAAAVLRRRRRPVLAVGAVGLLAGIAFALTQPPSLTSTTLVLLPAGSSTTSGRDITTEVRIVTSASILDAAGKQVSPPLGSPEVEKRIKVSAPTTQLIEIQATGPTATAAKQLAQGIADSYVDYEQLAAKAVSGAAMADLQDRRDKLQAQVTALQKEIVATTKRRQGEGVNSDAVRKDSQLLAQLQTEQADVTLQLDKVKGQMSDGLPAQTTGAQPSVVQAATPAVTRSPLLPVLTYGPLGFLLSAVLASGAVLAGARRDRRVRTRDEIADAVSGAVLASVRTRPAKTVAAWSLLLQSYEPSAADEWAYRQLLRSLLTDVPVSRRADKSSRIDHPASLTVVSLADDPRGLAIGPQLAAFTASRGINTRLITAVGGENAASLWAACAAERHTNLRDHLLVGEVRPGETADFTVVLAVVDPAEPDFGYSLRTDRALLAVAAGAATENDLARVAVAIDDARGRIDGIVIADADRTDRTTGRFSVEERAKQVALPLRITGSPEVSSKSGNLR